MTHNLKNWKKHINNYRIPILRQIKELNKLQGNGIEIGSGACWFSCLISRKKTIKKIIAIEKNPKKILIAKQYFIPKFGPRVKKIKIINTDFHKIPLKKDTLDFAICDAALHHSKNPIKLLKEINRVLKKNSLLIAIREPVLIKLPGLRFFRKTTFGLQEKLKGETENTYSTKQWKKFFNKSGFTIKYKPYFLKTTLKEHLISKLKIFNGILFSRYYFIAKKVKSSTYPQKNSLDS